MYSRTTLYDYFIKIFNYVKTKSYISENNTVKPTEFIEILSYKDLIARIAQFEKMLKICKSEKFQGFLINLIEK